jgi:hypothetical protein
MLIKGETFCRVRSLVMLAMTTAENPIVKPTERSIPPLIMTKVIPILNNRTDVEAKNIS